MLNLLAPCQCDLCGLPSGRDIDLCIPCEGELPWLGNCCRQCALPLAGGGPLCGRCVVNPPAFDQCLAACTYADPVSQWVQVGKYRGDFSRLAILASLMSRALARLEDPPDLVVPMPLHWRRRWRRGFNQAEALARELLRQPRLEHYRLRIDNTLCRRVVATPPLPGLEARQRMRNLQDAFRCSRRLGGKSIAIVDDVLTTGASAGELARNLKQSGAAKVQIWCAARTPEPA